MEIHRQDFEANLPKIREAITSADFIAIDTELTGLTLPDIQMQATDSLFQRYDKIKRSVEKFSICQYGVCTFKKDANGTFVAQPFNFYIFGADNDNVSTRRVFTSSASSIKFLRENNFDFNKWIDHGIPYYNYSEEDTKHTNFQGTAMHVRDSHILESSLNNSAKEYLSNLKKNLNYWWRNDRKSPLRLSCDKSFHKRLLYQTIRDSMYAGFLQAKDSDDGSNEVIINCLSEIERDQKYSQAPIVNFRTVIEMIKLAKCPVVLHNAAYDLCHTVDQFWRYLPNDVVEFKNIINSMWDQIVDTKYLAEHHPKLQGCFTSSALGPLYNQVNEELREAAFKIEFGKGFDRYVDNDDKAHEAAYDAYMTGVIYLAFIMYIQEKEDEKSNNGAITKADVKMETASESSSSSSSSSSESSSSSDDDSSAKPGQKRKNRSKDNEKADKKRKKKYDQSVKSESSSSSSSSSSSEDEDGLVRSSDEEAEALKKSQSVFMSDAIVPYYGRVFLMNSDIPYLNLKGKETLEVRVSPNKFFLRNIPPGLTKHAIERLYPTLQPFAISWINDKSAWLILRDESKIAFAKEGRLGLSLVQSFLPGSSREAEGMAYGISKEAGDIELMSHKNYIQQYGSYKVDHNNNQQQQQQQQQQQVTQVTPNGGSSYGDLDIPIPKSFQ